MAGKTLLPQIVLLALWALIFANGVVCNSHHHRMNHMCDALNESSEECPDYKKHQSSHSLQSPGMGPLTATEFEVQYLLYTKGDEGQTFTYTSFDSMRSRLGIIPNAPWKVLIHGFLNNGKTSFPQNVRKAYTDRMQLNSSEKYNVLILDWGKGACASIIKNALAPYHNAAENVEAAGNKLGDMLVKLHQQEELNVTEVHMIGHSLGSHVAGQAARRVSNVTGMIPRRISALDPAGPLFWRGKLLWNPYPYPRLRRSRVWFLDVYHTSKMFGTDDEMGDVDFYINGGEKQDSCKIRTPWFGLPVPVPSIFLQVCSHNFATDIFAKSIIDDTMRGCTGCYNYKEYENQECVCEDTPIMGEFVTRETIERYPSASGVTYIKTSTDTSVGSNYMQMLKNIGVFQLLWRGWQTLCL